MLDFIQIDKLIQNLLGGNSAKEKKVPENYGFEGKIEKNTPEKQKASEKSRKVPIVTKKVFEPRSDSFNLEKVNLDAIAYSKTKEVKSAQGRNGVFSHIHSSDVQNSEPKININPPVSRVRFPMFVLKHRAEHADEGHGTFLGHVSKSGAVDAEKFSHFEKVSENVPSDGDMDVVDVLKRLLSEEKNTDELEFDPSFGRGDEGVNVESYFEESAEDANNLIVSEMLEEIDSGSVVSKIKKRKAENSKKISGDRKKSNTKNEAKGEKRSAAKKDYIVREGEVLNPDILDLSFQINDRARFGKPLDVKDAKIGSILPSDFLKIRSKNSSPPSENAAPKLKSALNNIGTTFKNQKARISPVVEVFYQSNMESFLDFSRNNSSIDYAFQDSNGNKFALLAMGSFNKHHLLSMGILAIGGMQGWFGNIGAVLHLTPFCKELERKASSGENFGKVFGANKIVLVGNRYYNAGDIPICTDCKSFLAKKLKKKENEIWLDKFFENTKQRT